MCIQVRQEPVESLAAHEGLATLLFLVFLHYVYRCASDLPALQPQPEASGEKRDPNAYFRLRPRTQQPYISGGVLKTEGSVLGKMQPVGECRIGRTSVKGEVKGVQDSKDVWTGQVRDWAKLDSE